MAESKNQNSESDAFSQDDIDLLLQSASGNDAEGSEEIDSLLRNISSEETASDQNGGEGDNLLDDISPNDINDFLNTALADISVDDLEADLLQFQDADIPVSDNQNVTPAILDEKSSDHVNRPPERKKELDTTDTVEKQKPGQDLDAGGDVSQDDIDRMLAGTLDTDTVDTKKEPEPEPKIDTGGDVSQDDIDKMLAGNLDIDPSDTKEKTAPKPDLDAGGDVSQDDIDRLLAGNLDIDPPDTKEKTAPEQDLDAGGDVSQDDIDRLLAGETEADTPFSVESDLLPQDEDRSLYVSQEELDHLLEEYTNSPPDMKEQTKTSSQDEEISKQNEPTEILQNDIDMLLSSDADESTSNQSDPEEGLISQEDIDNLLNGVDEEQESEEDSSSLISQEDIDLLLKGVDDDSPGDSPEEDETDPVLPDDDGTGLVSQEDIDSLLRDDIDQEEAPADTEPQIELDRVVLEEDDDIQTDSEEDMPDPEETGKKKWYKSRLLVACSIGTIIFLISSVSLYFILSGDPDEVITHEIASIESKPLEENSTVIQETPVDLSVEFNDFIVLAPLHRDDISYLKADIQVTCISDAAVDKIVSQKPFFRFIIYKIFQQTLATLESPKNEKEPSVKNKKDDPSKPEQQNFPLIDQTKLKSSIRLSLEKALSEKGIKEIVMKNINLF